MCRGNRRQRQCHNITHTPVRNRGTSGGVEQRLKSRLKGTALPALVKKKDPMWRRKGDRPGVLGDGEAFWRPDPLGNAIKKRLLRREREMAKRSGTSRRRRRRRRGRRKRRSTKKTTSIHARRPAVSETKAAKVAIRDSPSRESEKEKADAMQSRRDGGQCSRFSLVAG